MFVVVFYSVMLKLFGCLLLGLVCGWLLRRKSLRGLSQLLMLVIILLLFVLGVEVAMTKSEIEHIFVLVGVAVVVALFATAGSLVGAYLLGRCGGAKKQGNQLENSVEP